MVLYFLAFHLNILFIIIIIIFNSSSVLHLFLSQQSQAT